MNQPNQLDPRAPLAFNDRPARELVHLAGDPDTGMSVTHRLNHAKREVIVTYKDFVLTVDIYQLPDEPLKVHLICPRCHHMLSVSAERKHIEFDPNAHPEQGGRLSIEPFECTWEIPEADKHTPGILAGGLSLCRWRAAIDKNVAKDA